MRRIGSLLSLMILLGTITLMNSATGTAVQKKEPSYSIYHVECKNEKACTAIREAIKKDHGEGAFVFTHFKEFFDVFVSRDANGTKAVDAIKNHEGYFFLEPAGSVEVPPPSKTRLADGSRGDKEDIVRGKVEGLDGEGVIVAILDTGIDFFIKDFIETGKDGKPVSRLLYYWDTFAKPPEKIDFGREEKPPVTYPNGVGIGALYTRKELTEAIRENDRTIQLDQDMHGTACAAVAAGNGESSKGKYRGVAPKADIIAIRVGKINNMENSYLLNAICGWLDELGRKLNKPVVISCSYGGHFGGYDGNNIEQRQLNTRFAPDVKGRAICLSGGNDGYEPIHVEVKVEEQKTVELKWNAPSGGELKLFFSNNDMNAVGFEGDLAKAAEARRTVHPPSKQVRMEMSVPAGKGSLKLVGRGKPLVVDAYIIGRDKNGLFDSEFESPKPTPGKLIKNPAATPNAITVGSYDWNPLGPDDKPREIALSRTKGDKMRVGALSPYSSPGPSRNADAAARVKPDLVSPGQWHIVCVPAPKREKFGEFTTFNGTSAATPYTAGVVALMLQARKDLTVKEIKDYLAKHLKKDDFTDEQGDLPNPFWGRGKLNAVAVRGLLKDVIANKGQAKK